MTQKTFSSCLRVKIRSTKKQKWTRDDQRQLKEFADQFYSVKEIARFMKRSPSSINTALDRYGLRVRKYIKHGPRIGVVKVKALQKAVNDNKRGRLKHLSPYVDLRTLMDWLLAQGVFVSQTGYREPGPLGRELFALDGIFVPAYQLLLKANELRRAKKMPIFLVKDITQE